MHHGARGGFPRNEAMEYGSGGYRVDRDYHQPYNIPMGGAEYLGGQQGPIANKQYIAQHSPALTADHLQPLTGHPQGPPSRPTMGQQLEPHAPHASDAQDPRLAGPATELA